MHIMHRLDAWRAVVPFSSLCNVPLALYISTLPQENTSWFMQKGKKKKLVMRSKVRVQQKGINIGKKRKIVETKLI